MPLTLTVAPPDIVSQDQKRSDAVLDDVSCMLGCTRSSLNGACTCLRL